MPDKEVYEYYDDNTGEVYEYPIKTPTDNKDLSDLKISESALLTLYLMAPLEAMVHGVTTR